MVDNLFAGKREFVPKNTQFVEMSILSEEVGDVFEYFQPDVVVHLAAIHYIPYCNSHPVETFEVNVMGTRNLLKFCTNVKFLFASSAAVYPPLNRPLVEHLHGPIDIYGKTKLIGEDLVRLYCRNPIIVRLFNVYGLNDVNPHLIPELVSQIKRGRRLCEVGNLSPKRDYIHVDDVCSAIITLLEHSKGGTYNVGTGREYSVEEVVKLIGEILDEEVKIVQVGERMRAVEREHLLADISKIKEETGWRPVLELKEGLKELIK